MAEQQRADPSAVPAALPDPSAVPAALGDAAALLAALPDAVLVLDSSGAVVAANPAAGRLTGWAPADLAERTCASLLAVGGHDGGASWAGGWPDGARLRSVRGVPPCAVTLLRADGTRVAVDAAATYVRDGEGRVDGAIVTFRRAGRRRAGEPSAMELVSTVSHELRSPLTSVKGYTSLMLKRWSRLGDDQKRMMLEQVNHDADRVVRLITELLDVSRLEAGRLFLRRQEVDLANLARVVVVKVRLEYPDLDADVVFDPDLPPVWADPDKVEQVLTNLVENACKYAAAEGITVRGRLGDGMANVVVTDRGDGIPSGDLARVFTKFFRRHEGKPTGSGLGLWISRGLIEAHGGELTAESPPGQGASFRFTLPLADVELQHP